MAGLWLGTACQRCEVFTASHALCQGHGRGASQFCTFEVQKETEVADGCVTLSQGASNCGEGLWWGVGAVGCWFERRDLKSVLA
jgi:hypothetical protein